MFQGNDHLLVSLTASIFEDYTAKKKLIFLSRESSMIYQEKYEDITHALKLSGVDVIAHEEAHQFFGNAATFEWWDYLW